MRRPKVTKELRSALRAKAWDTQNRAGQGVPIPVLTISADTLVNLITDIEDAEDDLLDLRRQIERLAAHAKDIT